MATTTPQNFERASAARTQAAAPAAASSSSGKATASLVLGVLGLIGAILIPVLGWILGAAALGLGFAARSEINRTGKGGMGMAKAGIALGFIAIALGIALVAAVVALA